MDDLTHLNRKGQARMVEVGGKAVTARAARAFARVRIKPEVLQRITQGEMPKGDVFAAARIAGIQAAKRTPHLIPLCHPIALTSVKVDFETGDDWIAVHATAKANDKTGVEMEALTAASVAALTLYDMCKSADRGMVIEQIRLEEKSGGKSGHFKRGES